MVDVYYTLNQSISGMNMDVKDDFTRNSPTLMRTAKSK